MSKSFKNQFSWSHSRRNLFDTCRRKYYFNYYHYWNGWTDEVSHEINKTYFLKNLYSINSFIGTITHNYISNKLRQVLSTNSECDIYCWNKQLLKDYYYSLICTACSGS